GALHETIASITRHGPLLLFAWVSAEQLGFPLPAAPILIAAGVLSATGQMSLVQALALGVAGCLVGDVAWYAIGKRRGTAVLRFVCKLALEPETCVRRSSSLISRYGGRSLLVAKFIPGVSAVAVPLAANSGMSVPSFLVYDLLGAALYVGSYVALGRLVGDRLDDLSSLMQSTSNAAFGVALVAALAIVAWRLRQRRAFRAGLRTARIAPGELRSLIDRGENPFIVDLRHAVDVQPDPRVIPGAMRVDPAELAARHAEIPRDREIVLYCT
ncbi:MAG TPA: VTT domain-containing protein, partial [Anaeromyxobacteraceae bacterium]|nr:VTT domain-containing protein [Anaeromyxobacteraceae bacterium]